MPKFQFIETEEIQKVVIFEAVDEQEAIDLMESVMSVEDLPNVETFYKNGTTDWSVVSEVREAN